MGTAAVFAFASAPGRIDSEIVGMTSDGSVRNLRWLATQVVSHAKAGRFLTALRQNKPEARARARQALVNQPCSWFFLDENKNASWVSYSAILDLKAKTVTIYAGHFEDEIETMKLDF